MGAGRVIGERDEPIDPLGIHTVGVELFADEFPDGAAEPVTERRVVHETLQRIPQTLLIPSVEQQPRLSVMDHLRVSGETGNDDRQPGGRGLDRREGQHVDARRQNEDVHLGEHLVEELLARDQSVPDDVLREPIRGLASFP